jgi:hypothetical protein
MGSGPVLAIYIVGGIGGEIWCSSMLENTTIGAEPAVYALWGLTTAHFIMNYRGMRSEVLWTFGIVIFAYSFQNFAQSTVDFASGEREEVMGQFGGAMSGFFLGIVLVPNI